MKYSLVDYQVTSFLFCFGGAKDWTKKGPVHARQALYCWDTTLGSFLFLFWDKVSLSIPGKVGTWNLPAPRLSRETTGMCYHYRSEQHVTSIIRPENQTGKNHVAV